MIHNGIFRLIKISAEFPCQRRKARTSVLLLGLTTFSVKEAAMAAIKYTKAEWVAQADIQELEDGKFRGVVLISHEHGATSDDTQHTVEAASDSPEQALEQAKALAHRILANVDA
jgi:hypothetical protein